MAEITIRQAHLQILHRDEALSLLFADFVDSADVGVVQRRCSASLATKTFEGLRIFGEVFRKEF